MNAEGVENKHIHSYIRIYHAYLGPMSDGGLLSIPHQILVKHTVQEKRTQYNVTIMCSTLVYM